MAKRSTRRLILDRLVQAEKFTEDASNRLAQVQQIYFDNGYPEGAHLELMRESLLITQRVIERFRHESA